MHILFAMLPFMQSSPQSPPPHTHTKQTKNKHIFHCKMYIRYPYDTHMMIIYIGGKPDLFACKQHGRGPASASVQSGLHLGCSPCD